MALNPNLSVLGRNRALNAAVDTVLDSGYLRIYDGTQPTDADTAIGAQVMLAELTLAATAFAAASSASKAAGAIGSIAAAATGTASWGSFVTSAGTRVLDFSVGPSGANLNLNSVAISSGATVACSGFTLTMAAG